MTDSAPVSDLDLFDDTVLVDPYPSCAALRDGVVRLPANDVYALTRYDVIRNALGDWESFPPPEPSASTRWSTRR